MKVLFCFLISLLSFHTIAQNTRTASYSQPKQITLVERWERMDDYGKHFLVSGLITSVSGTICYYTTKKVWLSVGVGAACGIASGIFKEVVWDGMMKRGVVSNEDFIASTNGALVGTFCIMVSFNISAKRKQDRWEAYHKLRRQHSIDLEP